MDRSVHVAIVGTRHYFGTEFIKPGQLIHLAKEPDNRHDHEAIRAEMTPIGKIGYVANSTHTVPKGCHSAGRVYDRFEDHVCAIVRFVVQDTVIAELAPGAWEFYIVFTAKNEARASRW